MATNEWGYTVLCTALTVVDDTSLVSKVVVSELKVSHANSSYMRSEHPAQQEERPQALGQRAGCKGTGQSWSWENELGNKLRSGQARQASGPACSHAAHMYAGAKERPPANVQLCASQLPVLLSGSNPKSGGGRGICSVLMRCACLLLALCGACMPSSCKHSPACFNVAAGHAFPYNAGSRQANVHGVHATPGVKW